MAETIGLEGVFDLSNFDKGIDSYLSGIKRAENATEDTKGKFGKAFDDMGSGVMKVAGLLSGALVAGAGAAAVAIGAFVVGGITKAADLEAQMGAIAAIMGETKDAVGPLKDLILDLGMDPTLKVNATEAADAIEKLASNGLTMTQIMDGAAKSTVLLANATDADFDTAAAIATDTMALFNIEASNMMEAVNGITGVTVASKFGINDYRLALAQAGGVAAATGVEFDDFNTSIAGMSNYFASGSDAGTSFKTFLQRLVPSTANAEAAMSELGLSTYNATAMQEYLQSQGITPTSNLLGDLAGETYKAFVSQHKLTGSAEELGEKFNKWAFETGVVQSAFFDANGQMKDMNNISIELNKALGGLSEQEKIKALSTIFGTDAMRAAVGIAEQGEVAYTDLEEASKALGVSIEDLAQFAEGGITKFEAMQIAIGKTDAVESAKVRMDNFKASMEILQGVIETVGLKIGFAFLPMLKALADRVSAFVDANSEPIIAFFEGFATAIEKLVSGAPWTEIFPGWLGNTVKMIANNMDILTGALGGIAVLLASAAIGPAFAAIGAAMAAVLSPMVLLVGGAAALGAAWNMNFLGIKDATLAVLDPITNYISFVAEAGIVSLETREALTLFPETLQPIIGAFMDTIAGIGLYSAAVLDAGVNSIESNEALTVFPESLRGIAKASLDTVLGLWAYGMGIREAGVFSIEAREALTMLPDSIEGIVGGFTETIGAIGNYISFIAHAGLGSIEANEALGLLKESFGKLVGALSEQLPIWKAQLLEWGAAAWGWIVDAGGIAITKLGEWTASLVGALAANLPTMIAGMLEWAGALVGWIGDAAADGITQLGKWVASLVTWLGSTGKNEVGTGAAQLVGALIDWIANDLVPKVAPAMAEFSRALLGALGKIAVALGTAALEIGKAIITSIMGADWQKVGGDILNQLKAGWEAAKAATLVSMTAIAASLKERFGESAQQWTAAGKDILDKVRAGIESTKAATLTTINNVATAMRERYVTPQGFAWSTIGADISNAVRDGLRQAAEMVGGILSAVINIATSIKDKFTNQSWSEIGTNIMTTIKEGLEAAANAASGILATITTIAQNLMKAFTEISWEEVGRSMARLIKDGFKTIAEGIGGLIPTAGDVANEVGSAFTDIDWLGLGKTIITIIGAGVRAVAYTAGGIISIAADIAKGFLDAMLGEDWKMLGTDIIEFIQRGVESATNALLDKVRGVGASIKKVFTDMVDEWRNIGKGIVDGIGSGITGARDALMQKAKDLADSLPGWMKEVLGISSPSRVFAEIGRQVVDGLIAGLSNGMPALRAQVNRLVSTLSISDQIAKSITVKSDFSDLLREYLSPLQQSLNEIEAQRQALYTTLLGLTREFNMPTNSAQRMQELSAEIQAVNRQLNTLAEMSSYSAQQLRNVQSVLTSGDQARAAANRLEAQLALINQAAELGFDVSGFVPGGSLQTLIQMANLERSIAQIKVVQLSLAIENAKANAKQLAELKGWRDAVSRIDDYNASLNDQISMMRTAAELGLDVGQLWGSGINVNDAAGLLRIQLAIANATTTSLQNEMKAIVADQKRMKGWEEALKILQPLIDQTDVSSVFGQRYKAQVLDPILAALEQAAGIDSERVRLINQYKVAAQELLKISKQEQDLAFLQQQLDVVKMIHDQDLVGGESLFAGITFGVNASIQDLLTLTTRVLNAMVEEVNDELGIHSPSSVFADIGRQMMTGMGQGIQRAMSIPLNALRQSTMAHGDVSTRTLNFAMGGVTINNGTDEVLFENRVLRILERALA